AESGIARTRRRSHRRHCETGRDPVRRSVAENAERQNHAAFAQGGGQWQNRDGRHNDAGRLECAGETQRGGVAVATALCRRKDAWLRITLITPTRNAALRARPGSQSGVATTSENSLSKLEFG